MRKVASTKMNEQSSRSHSVIKIKVIIQDKNNENIVRKGNMFIVNLAGTERLKKSEAQDKRLDEAKKITKSLFSLRNVLNALAHNALAQKKKHVPFNDSILTKILKNSIGGNCKTLFIANISPSEYVCQETLETLRYASLTKSIINTATIVTDERDAIINNLKEF
jgi:kinesin family protein 5